MFSIYKLLQISILWILLIATGQCAYANDEEVLIAKAAYDKKNVFALTESVKRLKAEQHILAPYADYWLMLLNLEDVSDDAVADFLNQYQSLPFTDRLRGEWLKKLAKAQAWTVFMQHYPDYQLEDPAVACYAAEANAAINDINTLSYAKALWLQPKEQPANCNNLFDKMQAAKMLSEDDLQARFRLALANSRLSLAKGIAARSTQLEKTFLKQMDSAHYNPQQALSKKTISHKTAYGKELTLYALFRIAKTDSVKAIEAYKKIQGTLNAEQRSYFYGQLALLAAQRHEPQALSYFQLTNNTTLNKEQLEWYVRSALRANDWQAVSQAIALMPQEQSQEPTWRYWQARALKALDQPLDANILFAELSTERHFYGWLSQEELGSTISQQPVFYSPTDADITAFSKMEAVQRAEALQRLDFKWEAKMEWALATEGATDEQLIAAAEYAARKKWFDLAVITADRTKETHNFSLRYPTPYRDLMKPAANEQAIDEAWVYGIIRQESRFMHYAKSNVGASGLMQLMPATAKWVAGKVGWKHYHHGMIHDIDTNIALGTYYMRYTLEQFNDQEVMATAAYNAGPSRAKKWVASTPLEGAIYAETIPFSETRNYVKKVLANAHIYGQRLGLKPVPLKKRLGVIPAKEASLETSSTYSD